MENNNLKTCKTCKTCKQLLPITDYHKDPKSKDKFFYSCKKCHSIYRKEVRRKNPKTEEQLKIHREKNNLYYQNNKEKKAIYSKTRREKNTKSYRNTAYKYKYGISIDEYEELLLKQNNSCDICKISQDDLNYNLVVDHCHTTKLVRGLLCRNCNLALGYLKDNIETVSSTLSYLNKYKENVNTQKIN
jgi:hypothetical protein